MSNRNGWREQQDFQDEQGQRGSGGNDYEARNQNRNYGENNDMQRRDRSNFGLGAERYASEHDAHYESLRRQQMDELDRDYTAWQQERRKKFSEEFEKWRSERKTQGQASGEDTNK